VVGEWGPDYRKFSSFCLVKFSFKRSLQNGSAADILGLWKEKEPQKMTTEKNKVAQEFWSTFKEGFGYLQIGKRKKTPYIVLMESETKDTFRYQIICKLSGRRWRDAGEEIDIPSQVRERMYDALKAAASLGLVHNFGPGQHKPKSLKKFSFAIYADSEFMMYHYWNLPEDKKGEYTTNGYLHKYPASNNNFISNLLWAVRSHKQDQDKQAA
jgi:hypothetical protein